MKVKLVNLHGRLVIPITDVYLSAMFDLREMSAGVYFLHASDLAGKTSKTFTILLTD